MSDLQDDDLTREARRNMNTEHTDTPCWLCRAAPHIDANSRYCAMTLHARKLERERNEARETCQEIDKSHRVLESEVKGLRARILELGTIINSEREQIKVDGLEITRLHSRVTELEKDKELLDWVEKTEAQIDPPIGSCEADTLWFVNEDYSGQTLRQAIDAAKGNQ